MKPSPTAPKRPALRYYGGKWRLAPWIISFFPEHQNYVEPCGGAASVLLQKPRSPLETYNDLDGNVVNFFRVLRDRPDELIRLIRLTPWARGEFEFCRNPSNNSLENARRFYVFCSMARGRGVFDPTTGMIMSANADASATSHHPMLRKHSFFKEISNRFRGIQIENRNALDVISGYNNQKSLIYFDPPYVAETRTMSKGYALEVDNQFHVSAAHLFHQAQSFVVVSGYACPLYAELYEAHGWERHDKEAQTNSGGKRIESVWLSPRTVEALGRPRQINMLETIGVKE